MSNHCTLCGLPVSRSTLKQTLDGLLDRIRRNEGAWLLTLNTEMIARFTRDPGYWNLVAQADIITADGMPLIWASRRKGAGRSIPERTTGVDLVDAFLRLPQLPIYAVIGGVEPSITISQYGSAAVEACHYLFNGKIDLSDKQVHDFVTTLRERKVQLVFLALGVPRGDQLALKIKSLMPNVVVTSIGGSFEILGPKGGRAPRWMQNMGMEWLFRLIKEPRRLWKRYVVHYPAGIGLLFRDSLRPLDESPRR